jgi:glycosyltransferase involved in cell wall biosynthesis
MRILFSLLDAHVGGGQRVAADTAGELARRGHEIGVVVPSEGPALAPFRALGARVHLADLTSLRDPRGARAGATILRDYDLLYSHTSVPGEIVGGAAARRAGRPHAVHRHIYPHLSPRGPVRTIQSRLYRQTLEAARVVICVANHVADDVRALGAPAARVHVVPNGVPLPKPVAPSPGDVITVGLLGRLDPQKGIDVLLDAVPLLRANGDVSVVIAGPPGPFAEYESDIRARAKAAHVEIRDGRADGEAFLRGLDIVVMPSRYEGSPLVLLEAMALGKPVVASAIPGVSEVLEGRDSGILVEPGDAAGLAAAISSLANEPERRIVIGQRARQLVEREYTIDRIAPRIADLVEGARAGNRIAIVTEIPAPFRIPLFNRLAREPGIELRTFFLSDRDPRRNYTVYEDEMAFERHTLPGVNLSRGGRWIVLTRGLRRVLREFAPDVVVAGGWNQPAFWQAARHARRHNVPLLVWVESTLEDARLDAGVASRVRHAFVRRAAGFIVPGKASRAYVRSLGVPENAIFIAPNAVDLEIFSTGVREAHANREALRRELDLKGTVVLYVGRFAPEKGLDVLLDAARGATWSVVLLGEGFLREELERSAPSNVTVGPYVPREALVPWFAAADIFVLPSRSEPWGMVLNEAAAAGLPIVATDHVGAAPDLVDGNGSIVSTGDVAELRAAIEHLANDTEARERAGRRSLELSETFTPERWAQAVAAAATRAGQRGCA